MAILCLLLSITNSHAQTPNIVLIIADDLGWSQLSTGNTNQNNPSDFYETPVLETLANEGVSFPSAYSAPICTPARSAILSGQYAPRPTNNVYTNKTLNEANQSVILVGPAHGLPDGTTEIPDSTITIAETMKTAGYTTAHIGKYDVGGSGVMANDVLDQGFDYNYGGNHNSAPGSYFATKPGANWRFHLKIGPELDPWADPYTASESLAFAGDNSLEGTPKHVTDAMADAAIDFMNNNNSNPFFIQYSQYAVHSPYTNANARPDLLAKYQAKQISNPSSMGHDNVGQAAIAEGMDQSIGRLKDYLETNC